jgi:hypothetical protein
LIVMFRLKRAKLFALFNSLAAQPLTTVKWYVKFSQRENNLPARCHFVLGLLCYCRCCCSARDVFFCWERVPGCNHHFTVWHKQTIADIKVCNQKFEGREIPWEDSSLSLLRSHVSEKDSFLFPIDSKYFKP